MITSTITRITFISLMIILSSVPALAQNARRQARNTVANAVRSAISPANVMMLPNTSTASIDLNTCDMNFIGGRSRPSSGGGGGGGTPGGTGQENYPPAPGPDYQPMTQHGQFVGWYSPEEVRLSQTDFPAALVSILRSNRYYGGVTGAASILYELGLISSPFAFEEAQRFMGN